MKTGLSPKKNARIANISRSKLSAPRIINVPNKGSECVYCSFQRYSNSDIEFNFEVITPLMQIEERNSAYEFFSL